MLCYEIVTTTGTSNSFIMSRAQHRQAGAIPFYSCCLWISVVRGAVNTAGEVSINKLRLTSFIEMLLYCIQGSIWKKRLQPISPKVRKFVSSKVHESEGSLVRRFVS